MKSRLRLPLLVFISALLMRMGVIAVRHFDGLYGQDAFAYFAQSNAIVEALRHGWSQLPPFFWPQGFPLIAALSSLIVGPGGPQLINILLGSLWPVILFMLARELFSSSDEDFAEICGLVAALWTVVAGQTVLSSVVVMSDTAAAVFLALGAWFLLRSRRLPSSWFLLPSAAACVAAALVIRWASLLAVPAFVALAVIGLKDLRRPLVVAGLALGATAVILAPQMLFAPPADGLGGYFEGWSLLNAFSKSFHLHGGNFVGASGSPFPNLLFYAAPFWHPALMPPLMAVFAVGGVLFMWRSGRRPMGFSFELLFLGMWLGVGYVFLIGLPMQNLRFTLSLWTPAVLLVAIGTAAAWSRWRRATAVLLLLSMMMAMSFNLWWWNRFFDRAGEFRAVAERVADLVPDGGVVLAFGSTLAVEHYAGVEVHELYSMDPEGLSRLLEKGRPILLVINRSDIETRWRDGPPFQNLKWLEKERDLRLLERIGPWSIAEICDQ